MANQEQLRRLKEGGVEEWNAWREENPEVEVDLSGANLHDADLSAAKLWSAKFIEADLSAADLSDANLFRANFSAANLIEANLSYTNLSYTNLCAADLRDANLIFTNLSDANLSDANLSCANLSDANFSDANLIEANLIEANLSAAKLSLTKLFNTNLGMAIFNDTTISKVKLLTTKGLDKIRHWGPSAIDHRTLQLSQGQLPDIFLKSCGLSAWEILAAKLHNPKLTPNQITDIIYEMDRLRNEAPLQVHNLFISYSHGDARFVDRIGELFDAKDVRYWRDDRDGTGGPIGKILVRAIEHNPVMLLILSANSLKSRWVVYELEKAIKIEEEEGRDVIYPITLDDAWEKEGNLSPILLSYIRNKYIVLDFSRWEDVTFLETQFTKLLNGLHLFYKEDRKEE